MEKVNLQFLSLLKSSLKDQAYEGEEIDFKNLIYINTNNNFTVVVLFI